MSVVPAFMSVHPLCTWCPWRSEKGIRSPGTGVRDGCDLPHRCWESNLGPIQEQVLLTTEPSPLSMKIPLH